MAVSGIKVQLGQTSDGRPKAIIGIVRPDGKVTYVSVVHNPKQSFAETLREAVQRAEETRKAQDGPEGSK